MFKNYIKIAWRHLLRNKVSSAINVLGLALALAIAILIGLYIRQEANYDNWMGEEQQIYRIYRHWTGSDGGWVFTPTALAATLRDEVPEVLSATKMVADEEILLSVEEKKIYAEKAVWVDSSFFATVSLPFLYGVPDNAFKTPNSIVLSEEFAQKLFGTDDPTGKNLTLDGTEQKTVTGVVKKAGNTHLAKDAFIRDDFAYFNDWLNNSFATYVSLPIGGDHELVSEKITSIVNPRIKEAFEASGYAYGENNFSNWKLQPISDIHLYSRDFTWAHIASSDIRHLYILGGIAAILLLIAIFNYINLTTAQSSLRAKEIGVRKVSGALKKQLIGQFLTESVFQTFLAIFFALGIAALLLSTFQNIFQVNIPWSTLDGKALGILISGGIFIGLIAGVYPAFVLSKFRPKRIFQTSKGEKGFTLRKFLVIAQFSAVVTMMITLGIMMQQVDYMLEEDLGFDGEQVLVVPTNDFSTANRLEQLRSEVLAVPGIQEFGSSSDVPGDRITVNTLFIKGKEEPAGVDMLYAKAGTIDSWDVQIKEGRNFSRPSDSLNFLVNETFVERFQIEDPLETGVKLFGDSVYYSIVGVVEDFHFKSLEEAIAPLAIRGTTFGTNISFKTSTANLAATIQGLHNIFAQVEPEHPMRYDFLDQNFAVQYQSQLRFRKGMTYATFLTIFIAILGLFGLATFMIRGRVKEIGIRKVLGASVSQIVNHLNKDFLLLVTIAIVIAIPISWYISNQWLQDFAYRITMPWWVFAVAALSAVGIALLTVSLQSVKAAVANPVESLRSE